jgi:hypothetical protein
VYSKGPPPASQTLTPRSQKFFGYFFSKKYLLAGAANAGSVDCQIV